jgi:hypothetical protein
MSDIESQNTHQDNKQIKVSRKSFDAACVFGAATLVQVIVPSPLDYFLFPAVAAAWFVQSGQDSWMIDYTYTHVKNLSQSARNLAVDFIEQHKQKALESVADLDENDDDDDDDDSK